MKRIIEALMIGLFFLLYTFLLKQLTSPMPISPMSTVVQLFLMVVVVLPLSIWSGLKTIQVIKRD